MFHLSNLSINAAYHDSLQIFSRFEWISGKHFQELQQEHSRIPGDLMTMIDYDLKIIGEFCTDILNHWNLFWFAGNLTEH